MALGLRERINGSSAARSGGAGCSSEEPRSCCRPAERKYWIRCRPAVSSGLGVSIWFQCADAIAIYHDVRARGIEASEPQVGNGLWDTVLSDPDGYDLHFESPTDVPEETKLSEVQR
jgi:hypothetical protein